MLISRVIDAFFFFLNWQPQVRRNRPTGPSNPNRYRQCLQKASSSRARHCWFWDSHLDAAAYDGLEKWWLRKSKQRTPALTSTFALGYTLREWLRNMSKTKTIFLAWCRDLRFLRVTSIKILEYKNSFYDSTQLRANFFCTNSLKRKLREMKATALNPLSKTHTNLGRFAIFLRKISEKSHMAILCTHQSGRGVPSTELLTFKKQWNINTQPKTYKKSRQGMRFSVRHSRASSCATGSVGTETATAVGASSRREHGVLSRTQVFQRVLDRSRKAAHRERRFFADGPPSGKAQAH